MANNKKVIEKLKNDPLMPLRHSCEHVLHTAMQIMYPELKKVMGPPIKDGFYFDFDLNQKISNEDFEKIESLMQKIIDADLVIKMQETTPEEAKAIFKDNDYKLETISEITERNEKITLCQIGEKGDKFYDLDLCAGPHVESTGKIKGFKLLSIAGAYYKGDEHNKMLTRIYGTAFDTKEALDEYLRILDEKAKNDHRELNKILDIFATSEIVGKGLIMYTPNGTIIKNELRNHLLKVAKKQGAKEVDIPHMAKIDLYEISGHAEKFKDELFKVTTHYDDEFVLKPVNCPHHTQIYASRPRSYKDLPIAYVESTQQHRDEKRGAMVGLNRALSFEIDDGHTFCTPEQIKGEVIKLIKTMQEFYEAFGMWGKHWVSLSFRDPSTPEKYIGDVTDWEKAQTILIDVDKEMNLGGQIMEGEAALYGPKLDVMMQDATGNERQLGTVQIDFAMPKRFKLTYIDRDGEEKTPVMIHRAILGSYHRFIANLLETTGGNLPVWLSPVQVEIIPISDKHLKYCQQILQEFNEKEIRAQISEKDSSMGAKIRDAQLRKIPYMVIIGDNEVNNVQISVRMRNGEEMNNIKLDEFVSHVTNILQEKGVKL